MPKNVVLIIKEQPPQKHITQREMNSNGDARAHLRLPAAAFLNAVMEKEDPVRSTLGLKDVEHLYMPGMTMGAAINAVNADAGVMAQGAVVAQGAQRLVRA